MTYPTTSVRVAVVEKLVQRIGDATNVQTTWGPPRTVKREQIMVVDVEGDEYAIPTAKAGRKHRQDDFTVRLMIFVASPGQTAGAAVARFEDLAAAIDSDLADAPQLGGSIDGLQWCEVAGYDGPNPYPLEREGFGADGELRIECHTRLN